MIVCFLARIHNYMSPSIAKAEHTISEIIYVAVFRSFLHSYYFLSAQTFPCLNIKLNCIIKPAYNQFDLRMHISNRKQRKISSVSSS